MTNERIINVYQTTPIGFMLPKELHEEREVTIGAKFSKETKNVLMGLTEEEREIFLPSIMNVAVKSTHWEESVKNYFNNLNIKIPYTGIKLNVTTKLKKINYNGEVKEIQYPLVVEDYIKWKQLLVDNTVAKSKEQLKEGIYKAYMIDEQAEIELQSKLKKAKDSLMRMYLELTVIDEKDEYINKDKIKYILFVLGLNPYAYSIDQQINELERYRDISLKQLEEGYDLSDTTLVKVLKDEKLKEKARISNLLTINVIKKSGDYYVDANDFNKILGKSLDDVINWFNDPNNSQRVAEMKHELKVHSEKIAKVN